MVGEKLDFEEVIFADLHIHSRFSRACSKDLNVENLAKWAKIKGLDLLGTGDFTHPVWLEELKEKLVDNGKGFFIHKQTGFPFILTGEISLMYSQGGKGRKIHIVLLVPSFEVVDKINNYFDTLGRRDYDGRPIFGISGEKFVRDLRNISKDIIFIPAHIWTPWFGIFGSMSGFDSLEECFGSELVGEISAIETGISSDPEMNWRIKEITDKNIAVVSFSDSHSFWPWRLGREATIFKKTDSYFELIKQIRENNFIGTIETEPAYGKYHWDGHRNCEFFASPEETLKLNGICPKCGKPLTIGVENRVEKIAGNSKGFRPENPRVYFKLLPLHEVISLYVGVSMNSKKVWEIYNNLISKFKNEFNILLNASKSDLENSGIEKPLVELILKNRKGEIKVQPGYDGVYGEAVLDDLDVGIEKQGKLF
ncbi:endonuclease Q family protein [Candidatus Pacearchaeota archaeon]|nr:endonuclease Q family protein [Candidatus Pacearchaeota archaeon]